MRVYLDNAATTAIDPVVLEEMLPVLQNNYGNPSSTHSHGREVRAAIEKARKTVAELLNATASEIFFTSGGTESDNTFLRGAARALNIKHLITSPVEHHAVLHTMEEIASLNQVPLHLVNLLPNGSIDFAHLEQLLATSPNALVSLMHGNNEIGNMTDIQKVGELCELHGALFHSDTVQTMGHFPIDLKKVKAHAVVGAAHKFHGPKGVGFLFVRKGTKIPSFITGGGQERNLRGGTENVAGIIGLAKALQLAVAEQEAHKAHILGLKKLMCTLLTEKFGADISFNGNSANEHDSLYTVLNASLPEHEVNSMLLFTLDLNGISASGGSACSSGAQLGSHVLQAIQANAQRGNIRFSFSKFNTAEDVRFTVDKLVEIYQPSMA